MNKKYTYQQQEAILYPSNLVITACPGSGKTTVIKEKIRNEIINLKNYQGVIAISFTKKASLELKKRCKADGYDTKQSFFGTIDKFCLEEIIFPFLSRVWGGKPRDCLVVESLDDKFKSFFMSDYKSPIIHDIVSDRGFKCLYEEGYLWIESFSGLATYILKKNKSSVKYIKAKFTHIFLDEYQDTSEAQHDLFIELVNLGLIGTAVGDINQSIYEFRGSSSKYLEKIMKRDDFKILSLDINHRCHQSINNYSIKLLNPSVVIEDDAKGDCRVYRYKMVGTYKEISHKIRKLIESLMDDHKDLKYSEIAILANKNKILLDIAVEIGLDYRLHIDTSLDKLKTETSALLADLLRFRFGAINSAQEIIDKYIGKGQKNKKLIRENLFKLKKCKYENLIDNLSKLVDDLNFSFNEKELNALNEILEDFSFLKLFKPIESSEVQIMNLHKSKGLEFHTVIHVGLEEWVFPYREFTGNWGDQPSYPNLNQELNLHYVGITRAQEYCFLIQASKRVNANNEIKISSPSFFLTLPQLRGLYVDL